MSESLKYDLIIDSLEELLKKKNLKSISVSEIAQNANIAKGSVYYYFKSKDEIFEALLKKTYSPALESAKAIAQRSEESPFDRMADIARICRKSTIEFLGTNLTLGLPNPHEQAYMYQEFSKYFIKELKPILASIIEQGIEQKLIDFPYPLQLAEIVLIVLTAKLNPQFLGNNEEDILMTMKSMIVLLEAGVKAPAGSINYLLNVEIPG